MQMIPSRWKWSHHDVNDPLQDVNGPYHDIYDPQHGVNARLLWVSRYVPERA